MTGTYPGSGIAACALIFFMLIPRHRTKLDNVILVLGNMSVVVFVISAYQNQNHDENTYSPWSTVGFVAVGAYMVLLLLAAIRLFGENNHQIGFLNQSKSLLGKALFYVLIPAFVLTCILLLSAWLTGDIAL